MSPKAFRELGDKFGTNPVGTGPFKFVEYRPGQHLIVDANPAYWGRKPAVQRIRYRFIPENGTRMAALEAGEVMLVDHWANTKRTMHANAEVDRLLVDARETFDDARVRADYRRAQEILWDECPWIWLYEQPDMLAISKELKGFTSRRDEYMLFWNASLEG